MKVEPKTPPPPPPTWTLTVTREEGRVLRMALLDAVDRYQQAVGRGAWAAWAAAIAKELDL